MRNGTVAYQAGFTLLELLIAMAIIGILAAIVMIASSDSRIASRNAAALAQMGEYEKALNVYYSEFGYFPQHPTAAHNDDRVCLGNGDFGNGCWSGANFAETSSRGYLTDALVPDFMPSLPGFDQGALGSPAYIGCTGNDAAASHNYLDPECSSNNFSMLFLLEGTGQDCGRYVMVDAGFMGGSGAYTLCRMNMTADG